MDTIYAEATARGKAGVSVVRISGPLAFYAAESLAGSLPKTREAGVRVLRNAAGDVLDEALVLCFAQGASFTGEPVVELQLHGSVAVVRAVLAALSGIDGLRHAEAGEFTRRALENERLDLAQIEGLSDLIEAETEAQRTQALRVFSGALGDLVERWRANLIRAAALLEATIDFADEEVPTDVYPEVGALLAAVQADLTREIEGSHISERIRDGFEVAIVGRPNAGKSTLLNALAGRQAAITSEVAGTTRDVIEVRMDLSGIPVTVLDTAGLRETDDVVEKIGVDLALARAERADIRVHLLSSADEALQLPEQAGDVRVVGKDDDGRSAGFSVSGKTGHGVRALMDKLAEALLARSRGAATATHARHRESMLKAAASLELALNAISDGYGAELSAEYLRQAIYDLDCLVGRVDVEAVLGEIFSSFCIGK